MVVHTAAPPTIGGDRSESVRPTPMELSAPAGPPTSTPPSLSLKTPSLSKNLPMAILEAAVTDAERYCQMAQELEQAKDKVIEEKVQLQEKYDDEIAHLQAVVHTLQAENSALLDKIKGSCAEHSTLMKMISDLKSDKSELQKKLRDAQRKLNIQKRARKILDAAYAKIFDKAFEEANAADAADTGRSTLDHFFKRLGKPEDRTKRLADELANTLVTKLTSVGADDNDGSISHDDRAQAVSELFDTAQKFSGGDPILMASLFQQALSRMAHDASLTETFQVDLLKDTPWVKSVAKCAKIEEALANYCSQLRPKGSNGALTDKQKSILYPLARSLVDEGLPWTTVSAITGLGWRASRVVQRLIKDAKGDYTLPQRKRRSDARDGDADECRKWWLENSRPEPGMCTKHSVVDPDHKRVKGVKAPGTARSNVRWVRGTYLQLFKDYCNDISAKHAERPQFVVPSYSFFMRNKPHTIRKEGKQTCLCTLCLQTDLMAAAVYDMTKKHSSASNGCRCNKQAKRVESARAARTASMCPRADSAHAMFDIKCVNQSCQKCGVKTLFTVGSTPCGESSTPAAAAPAPDSTSAPAGVSTQTADATTNSPVILCPQLFRAPELLRGEAQSTPIQECSHCSKPRHPRSHGVDSADGKICGDHCSCGCVTVAMLKKVSYTNSKGEEKKRDEFVDIEMTPDELWIRFSDQMIDYIAHLEKASVQDSEARQFSDDVPIHSIFSICDFAENGAFDPRAEWVQRHWFGSPQYTVFPVVVSVNIGTIKDSSIASEDKKKIREHLEELGAPPTVKEVHYFVSSDNGHNFAAVKHYLSELDEWFDENYDAAPVTYDRDDNGVIKVDEHGNLKVKACDCSERCRSEGCSCPGDGSCARVHVTSSDGAGCQFKCRELHRFVADSAHSGKRRRVWMYKAGAHGRVHCAACWAALSTKILTVVTPPCRKRRLRPGRWPTQANCLVREPKLLGRSALCVEQRRGCS